MLKVIIEMWPKGSEANKFVHSTAIMYNDGKESFNTNGEYGSYRGVFMQSHQFNPNRAWKTSQVKRIHRRKRGVWDILFCLLYKAGMWDRNKHILLEGKRKE